MKKYKFLIIAFICMAILLLLPTTINAEEEIIINKVIEIYGGGDIYRVMNGVVEMDKLKENNISYNEDTNTLTFTNYDGQALYLAGFGKDLKIELTGNNKIHPYCDLSKTDAALIISGAEEQNVEFVGEGTLLMDVKDAIDIRDGKSKNDLEKQPQKREIIITNGSIIINGPEITIKSELPAVDANSIEIKSGKLITNAFCTTGAIVISGGEVEAENGIDAGRDITITGGKTTVRNAGCGLSTHVGDITITGGIVDIETEEDGVAMLPQEKIVLGENMAITDTNLKLGIIDFEGQEFYRIVDKKTNMVVPNVKIVEYSFTKESENQQLDGNKAGTLTFTIDSDYEAFKNGGKVFIDGKQIASEHFVTKEGSTIITFNESYAKSLANGKHEIEVQFANGVKVTTNFTVVNSIVEDKEEVTPEVKPEIKDETTDKTPVVKDETPDTGRQEVNMQGMIAVIMLGIVGAVVVSKKRA